MQNMLPLQDRVPAVSWRHSASEVCRLSWTLSSEQRRLASGLLCTSGNSVEGENVESGPVTKPMERGEVIQTPAYQAR